MRQINFMMHPLTGLIVSKLSNWTRVDHPLGRHDTQLTVSIAWPIYGLGFSVRECKKSDPKTLVYVSSYRIPLEIQNAHRVFWKMPLKKCRVCTKAAKLQVQVQRVYSRSGLGTGIACGQCLTMNPEKLRAKLFALRARMSYEGRTMRYERERVELTNDLMTGGLERP